MRKLLILIVSLNSLSFADSLANRYFLHVAPNGQVIVVDSTTGKTWVSEMDKGSTLLVGMVFDCDPKVVQENIVPMVSYTPDCKNQFKRSPRTQQNQ